MSPFLKETQPHERRVALVPSVVPKLIKLGAKLHMQEGAGNAIKLTDDAFQDVVFMDDRTELVSDADVVLAVQPPALDVIDADEGGRNPDLVHLCEQGTGAGQGPARQEDHVLRHGTSPAHFPGTGDGCPFQPICAGGILRRTARRDASGTRPPKITTAAGAIGPAKVLVMGLGVAGLEALATAHRLGAVTEGL